MDTAAKCDRNMIADDCGNHSCGQCQTGGRFNGWSGGEGSWWVTECGETSVITALRLLIIRYIAEKRDMFHIYSLILNSDVEFIYKICFSYEFDKFENHQ